MTGEDADIHEGDVVNCEGTWVTYKGAPQFKSKTVIPQIPATTAAIVEYLANGRVKGISRELTLRLVAEFGEKTLEVIENEPEKLRKVKGFGKARVTALKDGLRDQVGFRSILLFLHRFGLSKRHIKRIYDAYGVRAVELIKNNPYQLCNEIDGIGFSIADRIALMAGKAPDSPERIMAGISHVLDSFMYVTGDTGITAENLINLSFSLLNKEGAVDADLIAEAVNQVASSTLAKKIEIDGQEVIFPVQMYTAELTVAKQIARLTTQQQLNPDRNVRQLIDDAEKRLNIKLGDQQREAVQMCMASPIAIVTGGPGTGKTTIVRTMLDCLMNGFGYSKNDIMLCAPTGKAGKRLSESTGMDAMTVHRALSFNPEAGGFEYNSENPMPYKVVVVDEFSMADTLLSYWLLQAIQPGTQLIILGDVDQLPSVGPGKVLGDMICSDAIPYIRLTEIYRQGPNSHIIVNAHRVNRGEMPEINNASSGDFWFIKALKDEQAVDQILSLVGRMADKFNLDPFEDIQILTPMRRGATGQVNLNNLLQKTLNAQAAPGLKVKQDGFEVEFKVGDKVMHIKNNRSLNVFNGETGRVDFVDIKARTVKVNFEGRHVLYALADLEELRLSYAMTIHKSQGSEYPCVIVVTSMSHYMMLNRNLFYTGITRGKRYCAMVGDPKAMQVAVSRISSNSRLTGLVHHLKARV